MTLEVAPTLATLLGRLPGVAAVVTSADPAESDDHVPLASLPLAFGTTLQTIPAAAGYLEADPRKIELWRARPGPRTRPRIGLAWSGNPLHKNDRYRSLPLAELVSALPPGNEYFALQKDLRTGDAALLGTRILHVGATVADFDDTAALVRLMDRVVSVDTSIAHLAGALAQPVLVLVPFNPDWRWLQERHDSPWYTSARILRQHRSGDWSRVLARLASELQP